MSTRITPDHLGRAAVVYVRQSTMAQVTGNLESQRRQYDLAGAAATAGFASVIVIDDDLGRSGSGCIERNGSSRWFVPAMSARSIASRHQPGPQGTGLAPSDRSALWPALWSLIRMAPMIRGSSTIVCCLG